MSDLVKRLRHGEYVESMMNGEPTKTIEGEAAAEIERLQAESAKLRKHAEAMYLPGDMPEERLGDFMEAMRTAWNAYRADFPKEPDK